MPRRDLMDLIARLFPPEVHTVTAVGDVDPPPLLPEEERCIQLVVEKRRREFAAGRACARRALEHFGISRYPLLVGPDRAPIWPRNIVGSITHCDGFVGAAVAREGGEGGIRGIGVDAERAEPLGPDLVHMICSPRELAWIRAVPPPEWTDWPKVFFSAKEAVYKCLTPWCETPLGFHDVELALRPVEGSFDVHFTGKRPVRHPEGAALRGRFATSQTHVFAGLCLTV